jgi:uncharacterized protein YebE (UPF0316 family)
MPQEKRLMYSRIRCVQNGFGVTLNTSEGMDGNQCRMGILTRRNRENEFIATFEKFENKAFIVL